MNIDQIIQKVQKLRALSQSPNINEATRAAALAFSLIQKYDIEESQLEGAMQREEEVEGGLNFDGIQFGARKVAAWKGVLANSIGSALGCCVYWTAKVIDNRFVKALAMIGRKTDARTASYLFGLIANDIARIADAEWRSLVASGNVPSTTRRVRYGGFVSTPTTKTTWVNAFCLGAAATVGNRLKDDRYVQMQETRAANPDSQALVVINRRADKVTSLARDFGLSCGRRARTTRSYNAYQSGRIAGNSVNLGGRASGGITTGLGRVAS